MDDPTYPFNKVMKENIVSGNILCMCIDKKELNYLCELFPLTAVNIRQRSLERRLRFMFEKYKNSIKWQSKEDQYKTSRL